MHVQTLTTIFNRDLQRLREEISLYRDETNIWKIADGISNSAGNLCLHLVGNLNTYIGKEIGKTGYIRNRELEFSLKDIPRTELVVKINETKIVVMNALQNMRHEDLEKEFPVLVLDKKTSIEYMLVHLTTHLTYHLGQINYHRRMLDF